MRSSPAARNRGFTLVELLVVVAVAGLVMIAAWMLYKAQRQTTISQEQITGMQQNLRVAVFQMKNDLRMAGYDPTGSGNFGITFAGFRDLNDAPAPAGLSAIIFTADLNENGVIDGNETISYVIYDAPFGSPDGSLDLGRNIGGGRQLAAENIAALGLAYAFDNDNDGLLDRDGAGNVIWAIDTNNDGLLDTNLDTTGDGVIDCRDGADPTVNCLSNNLSLNENIGGTALATPVPLARIRAVRIWLLAQARNQDESYYDSNTYTVGRQILSPRDNTRRRLFETTVQLRNMGLN